jgi:hypothetical protein
MERVGFENPEFRHGGNAVLFRWCSYCSGIRQLEDATEYQVSIDAGVVTDDANVPTK